MVLFRVVIEPSAAQEIRSIFNNSAEQERWSFSETVEYVSSLEQRIYSLAQHPQRFSYDEFTTKRQYRSFGHGSHKVFYAVDENRMIVHVAAILRSRSNYGKTL